MSNMAKTKKQEQKPPEDNTESSAARSWIKKDSLVPDVLALGLLLLGILLWLGFTGKSGGNVILSLRRTFTQFLGTGRFIFVLIPIALGTGIFIARYSAVRIKIPLKKIFLTVLLFSLFLALATNSHRLSGGLFGKMLFDGMQTVFGDFFATVLLWIGVAAIIIVLFELVHIQHDNGYRIVSGFRFLDLLLQHGDKCSVVQRPCQAVLAGLFKYRSVVAGIVNGQ